LGAVAFNVGLGISHKLFCWPLRVVSIILLGISFRPPNLFLTRHPFTNNLNVKPAMR